MLSDRPAHAVGGARCGDFGGRTKGSKPCQMHVVPGTRRCKMHAGKTLAKAKAEGQVRLAVLAWDLSQPTVDPGESLLRLLTVTYTRAQWLAGLLQDAYDAAERLRTALAGPLTIGQPLGDETPEAREAADALDQVLARGGVSALIGKTYASAGSDGAVFATGEAIRGLAALEQSERKLAADLAAKAVAAGIAERQVRLAERQADLMVAIVAGTLRELGQDADEARVSAIVEGQIVRALAAGG